MTELIDSHLCFGGEQQRYRHRSEVLGCEMVYSVYLPPQARQAPVPVLYYLSGLTCTDENFVAKAGAQQYAAALVNQYRALGAGLSDQMAGVVGQPEIPVVAQIMAQCLVAPGTLTGGCDGRKG